MTRRNPIGETSIQAVILQGLHALGFAAWRNQQIPPPIRRGRAIVGLRKADPYTVGAPDIFLLEKGTGRLIGIEVKAKYGTQEPAQVIWQERLERNGARYILARSWDDVAKALKL